MLSEADLPDLQAMFADDTLVSHNPMGNLTQPSAVIIPDIKVIAWSDWMANQVIANRRKNKKEALPEGQLGLGF